MLDQSQRIPLIPISYIKNKTFTKPIVQLGVDNKSTESLKKFMDCIKHLNNVPEGAPFELEGDQLENIKKVNIHINKAINTIQLILNNDGKIKISLIEAIKNKLFTELINDGVDEVTQDLVSQFIDLIVSSAQHRNHHLTPLCLDWNTKINWFNNINETDTISYIKQNFKVTGHDTSDVSFIWSGADLNNILVIAGDPSRKAAEIQMDEKHDAKHEEVDEKHDAKYDAKHEEEDEKHDAKYDGIRARHSRIDFVGYAIPKDGQVVLRPQHYGAYGQLKGFIDTLDTNDYTKAIIWNYCYHSFSNDETGLSLLINNHQSEIKEILNLLSLKSNEFLWTATDFQLDFTFEELINKYIEAKKYPNSDTFKVLDICLNPKSKFYFIELAYFDILKVGFFKANKFFLLSCFIKATPLQEKKLLKRINNLDLTTFRLRLSDLIDIKRKVDSDLNYIDILIALLNIKKFQADSNLNTRYDHRIYHIALSQDNTSMFSSLLSLPWDRFVELQSILNHPVLHQILNKNPLFINSILKLDSSQIYKFNSCLSLPYFSSIILKDIFPAGQFEDHDYSSYFTSSAEFYLSLFISTRENGSKDKSIIRDLTNGKFPQVWERHAITRMIEVHNHQGRAQEGRQ